MKDKLNKTALLTGAAALAVAGGCASNVGQPESQALQSKAKQVESNTRRIVGHCIGTRITNLYCQLSKAGETKPKPSWRYVVMYMDTDNDEIEDCIVVQKVAENELRYNYSPRTLLEITEVKGKDGKWLVDNIKEATNFMEYIQSGHQK